MITIKMSLNACVGAARLPRARSPPFQLSSDPDQLVVVRCAGREVAGILRRQLLRFKNSYPYQLFRDGSMFLGNVVLWKSGAWHWDVRDARSHDEKALIEVIAAIADPAWPSKMSAEGQAFAIAWGLGCS